MRTRMPLAAIVAAAFALTTPAIAHGAPTEGATVTRDVNQTILYTNPCTGVTGELALHYTLITNGVNEEGPPEIQVTQTLVGDFAFADGATGHFTVHGGFHAAGDGLVIPQTTEAHGTTADGSRFSLHFASLSNDAPPQATLTFEHCA